MRFVKKIIEFGFYFLIFLLPWQTRLIWHDSYLNGDFWEYGRFSLYGTELLLWLVLFFYVFYLFKNKKLQKISFNQFLARLKNPAVLVYWLIVLFLLIAGLSVIWSIDSQLAYQRWFTLLEAGALFSLILGFDLKLEKIAISWVAAAAIQGVFGIWQFLMQYTFAEKWLGLAEHLPTVAGSIILENSHERWLRAYGSLPHPNMLGAFLAIGLLFLLYLALIAKKRKQRIFVLASLVTIVPALFFSFSRSAWLALIFTLTYLGFWLWRRNDRFLNTTFFKIIFLILLITSVLAVNLWDPLTSRLLGQDRVEAQSIDLRIDLAKQAVTLIMTHPWQGTGIGNYTLAVYEKINSHWPGYYYQPVHNIYLLIWSELGIFGAMVFGLILVLLIWNLIKPVGAIHESPIRLEKAAVHEPPGQLERIIVFLALVLILIISLFDHYFWTLYFGVMVFWIILALNLKQLNKN